MSFTLVTGNLDKVKVVESIIGHKINHIDIDVEEIQEFDQEKISTHKAKQAWEQVKKPLVVWDMAVYIDCLNGFPGPLIKWFYVQVGLEKICDLASFYKNRNIKAVSYITYIDEDRLVHFTGEIKGTLPLKPRGKGGFGWDPIFIEDGYNKTSAELKETDPNYHVISKNVFKELETFLKTL